MSSIAADQLETDAVTTTRLAQFFDWLKGTGWTRHLARRRGRAASGRATAARQGDPHHLRRRLREPLHARLSAAQDLPLSRSWRRLVGSWMEGGRPDGTVLLRRRSRAARELHLVGRGARDAGVGPGRVRLAQLRPASRRAGQPAGQHDRRRPSPGGTIRRRALRDDAQYRARIRADLSRSRSQLAANLGRAPRAMVWPFGRYSGPPSRSPSSWASPSALTLEPEPAYTSDLFAIHRYFPSQNPALGDIARNLRFEPDRPATRRIVCLQARCAGRGRAGRAAGRGAWADSSRACARSAPIPW